MFDAETESASDLDTNSNLRARRPLRASRLERRQSREGDGWFAEPPTPNFSTSLSTPDPTPTHGRSWILRNYLWAHVSLGPSRPLLDVVSSPTLRAEGCLHLTPHFVESKHVPRGMQALAPLTGELTVASRGSDCKPHRIPTAG